MHIHLSIVSLSCIASILSQPVRSDFQSGSVNWRTYSNLLAFTNEVLYRDTVDAGNYLLDLSPGLGLQFDGIGAISGGGATSKLLINYPEPYRAHILDFLFKPNFGASLQILKVEIGGDSQSTDGTESSHMHDVGDENYQRGYEWWLMKEAKLRSPALKLYGLPWVFPGWLNVDNSSTPYGSRTNLCMYILNWLAGAQNFHNLTIDYVGIWNERKYDLEYIKMLRAALDHGGFSHVQIVASDGGWAIARDILQDTSLSNAVAIVGAHYPGSFGPAEAGRLKQKLWASEEYSDVNSLAGGACWARILNEGYVNGFLTGTIAWNLVSSYYGSLPYALSSLMTANEPWTGHYKVNSPIWQTAHHTHFTRPGWHYLKHGIGVGNLTGGGTFVSLISPDHQHLTLIISTINPLFGKCFYNMPKYKVSLVQEANFIFKGILSRINTLNVWFSKFDGDDSVMMKQLPSVNITSSSLTLILHQNEVYTLSTLEGGGKGHHIDPPLSGPFPSKYSDNFGGYPEEASPYNLAAQAGVFEVHADGSNKYLKQVVTAAPIDTCLPQPMDRPVAIVGDSRWKDLSISCSLRLPDRPKNVKFGKGAFLALRFETGGCRAMYSNGVFLWIFTRPALRLLISASITRSVVLAQTKLSNLDPSVWHHMNLTVQANSIVGYFNSTRIDAELPEKTAPVNGFAALGLDGFYEGDYDNLKIVNIK